LLDNDQQNIILTDFGLAKELNHGFFDDFPGTVMNIFLFFQIHLNFFFFKPLYNSPEKFKGEKYCGVKNDIWSLGIYLILISFDH
jgi:serine/threonine protein kinase